MPTPDRLVAIEAAAILDKNVRTIHRMIRRGILSAEKLPGRTGAFIIPRAEVEALLPTQPDARTTS